jgi:hypothetical protein
LSTEISGIRPDIRAGYFSNIQQIRYLVGYEKALSGAPLMYSLLHVWCIFNTDHTVDGIASAKGDLNILYCNSFFYLCIDVSLYLHIGLTSWYMFT